MAPTSSPAETTGPTIAATTPAGRGQVEVLSVTDGDTFNVILDGMEDTVRLIGINTPERGECLAEDATAALTSLLDSNSIELVADTTERDRYDRLLRYVWIGDTLVNEELVRNGLAVARRYEPDTAQAERLEAAQAHAKQDNLGIWAIDSCGPPATSNDASPNQLRIDHIEADAPGDDSIELNGEWVRIVNDGSSLDLDGWQLRDESASHRYRFPPLTLDPNDAVTVFSGCGADSDTDLYWCNSGSAIWNNDGDTAFLVDPAGNVATSLSY